MGTVIEFPKVRSSQARSIDLDEFCRFGEVVLFTGVRYSGPSQTRQDVDDCHDRGFGEDQDATG